LHVLNYFLKVEGDDQGSIPKTMIGEGFVLNMATSYHGNGDVYDD